MKNLKSITILYTLMFLVYGCNQSKEINAVNLKKKKKTLSSQDVVGGGKARLGGDTKGVPNGTPNGTSGVLPGAVPAPNDKTPPGAVAPNPNAEFPITTICGEDFKGKTVLESTNLKINFRHQGKIICSSSDSAKILADIKSKKITIPDSCLSEVMSLDKFKSLLNLASTSNDPNKIQLDILGDGSKLNRPKKSGSSSWQQPQQVLYYNDGWKKNSPDGLCDSVSSPLFVDLRTQSEKKNELFTSQENGHLFDIMGANAKPAHSKHKISWFTSSNLMFLVLTQKDEETKNIGIDQLFGDNTMGPDGKFAPDGFAALAKYDARDLETGEIDKEKKDGLIDSNDQVYKNLRLWSDKNLNARLDDGELLKLSDLGIVFIDLKYDPDYEEVDRHGNTIKYKSIVSQKKDDIENYFLIFDVWFLHSMKSVEP